MDLWHLRPLLAVAVVVAGLIGMIAASTGHGRRTASLLIAAALIALIVDALVVDGVRTSVAGGGEHAAEPSPWVIVPILGGLMAIASLLRHHRPLISRRMRPPSSPPTDVGPAPASVVDHLFDY
jgi:hypothetical protein